MALSGVRTLPSRGPSARNGPLNRSEKSGLLMWWQLKKLRMAGAVALGLGLICFVAMAIAMHGDMA